MNEVPYTSHALRLADFGAPHPIWVLLHPNMTAVALGNVPTFLSVDDPRPAREQFNERYQYGGWKPMQGCRLRADNSCTYPGDPPFIPLAQTQLRDELIVFYPSEFVGIIQPDRSFEISRMD